MIKYKDFVKLDKKQQQKVFELLKKEWLAAHNS